MLLHVKYLRDIRGVRQNTTLYYDVMCHRTDNVFRPFTIRPSSGLVFTHNGDEPVKDAPTCFCPKDHYQGARRLCFPIVINIKIVN